MEDATVPKMELRAGQGDPQTELPPPSSHGRAGIGASIDMHICARRQAAMEAESWQLDVDKLRKLWYNKA